MTVRERGRCALAGIVGGAWGGALTGLGEAASVATGTAAADAALVAWALAAYGLLGALPGALVGVVASRRRAAAATVLAVAAGASLVVTGVPVARYHVLQRVLLEGARGGPATGVLVTAGITVLCAGMGVAVAAGLRRAVGRRGGAALAAGALGILVAAAAALGAAGRAPVAAAPLSRSADGGDGRPNLVLIIADTLRADSAAARIARAPGGGLAALAAEGVTFTRAYAQAGWTRPSVATLLTGLYPSEHGAVHKMSPLPAGVDTLAELLGARGYRTAAFVNNFNVAPVFNFQQGFDEYTYLAPSFYFRAPEAATRLAAYRGLRVVRERWWGHRLYVDHYYRDARAVAAAVSGWLAAGPPAPFFLLVHFMDPHDPYFAIPYDGTGVARVVDPDPPADRRDAMRALYEQNVAYFDEVLAELLVRLRARDDYDRTLVALVSDHGEEFHEHGGWWHGETLYEEQVRVPLIVKRPHGAGAGSRDARPARLLDVAPTLLAAAGVPPAPAMRGVDLFAPAGEPPVLFAEQALGGTVVASVQAGAWKLIVANAGNPRGLPPVALYDLSADPEERHNRAAELPERVVALREALERLRGAFAAPPS